MSNIVQDGLLPHLVFFIHNFSLISLINEGLSLSIVQLKWLG